MRSVLIVGDGNFSFSLSFRRARKDCLLVATSLETREEVRKHESGERNLGKLEDLGVPVYHEIDATKLELYNQLKHTKYDCIIFNFPHTGGKSNIRKNRDLVQSFLHSSFKILDPLGEVWITLCQGQGGTPVDCGRRGYNNSWKIIELAAEENLILTEVRQFQYSDWPDYVPTGYRSQDKEFVVENALTHVFTKSWTDREFWKLNSTDSKITFCKSCKSDEEHKVRSTHPSIDLANSQYLEYLIFEQPWHPITVMNTTLVQLLTRTSVLPINVMQSSVPVAHTGSSSSTTAIELVVPSSDSPQRKCFLEQSLVDRIPCLLAQSIKPMYWIISSPIFTFRQLSIQPKDQLVSHQLMCLVVEESISQLETADLKGHISDTISSILHVNDFNISWKSTETMETLILRKEDDSIQMPLATLSPFIPAADTLKLKTHSSLYYQYVIIFLEQLVVAKFDIPDVRLIWSKDSRFFEQFNLSPSTSFKYHSFSLYPPQFIHDVSFWIQEKEVQTQSNVEYLLFPLIQEIAGRNVSSIQCIDTYKPTTPDCTNHGSISYCYRIIYYSADEGLGYSSVLKLQEQVRDAIQTKLHWVLR